MNRKVNPYPINKIFKNKLRLRFGEDYNSLDMVNPDNNGETSNTAPPTGTVSVMEVFNSLRIPDAIKDLPQFNGNPRLLFDFLDNCNEILDLISITSGSAYGQLLLRAIRNKIIGPANEVLNMYGTPLVWDDIRNNLIHHYADKRNETSLIRDLHKIKQNNSTVEKFYGEVIEILSSMTNHINIHENNNNVILAKKALYQEMSLNAFLTGLKEPLGATVRAMKPTTLAEAFSFCIKEQNIFYSKFENRNFNSSNPISQNRHSNNQRFQPRIQTIIQKPLNFNNRPQISRPFNPHFIPRQPQQNFSYRSQQQPNSFPRNNAQIRPSNGPTPMDIGSSQTRNTNLQHNRYQPNNNFFRQTGPPNFISEELFNVTEHDEFSPDIQDTNQKTYNVTNMTPEISNSSQYIQNLDYFYDNYNPDESNLTVNQNIVQQNPNLDQDTNELEQNFRTLALENVSDT